MKKSKKHEIWKKAKSKNEKYEYEKKQKAKKSNMKYEKKNVKKKMSNMTHKHQPRKIYNMKYDKKRRSAISWVWNMKNSTDKKRNYFRVFSRQYEIWKIFHIGVKHWTTDNVTRHCRST